MSEVMEVGALVRILKTSDANRVYQRGIIHVVAQCDPSDSTVRLRRIGSDNQGPWISWKSVERVENLAGWDFLKRSLTPATSQMLEAFAGLEALQIRPQVADRVLRNAPDIETWLREYGAAARAERDEDESPSSTDEDWRGGSSGPLGELDVLTCNDDDLMLEELDTWNENRKNPDANPDDDANPPDEDDHDDDDAYDEGDDAV
jgi:hypothetical protein